MTRTPKGRAVGPCAAQGSAITEHVMSRHASADGGGVQIRKRRAGTFTPEKQEAFFAHLSETANNAASARDAGVAAETVRTWRRTNADFRKRWERSLADGYADLEMKLLAVALFGAQSTTVTSTDKEGKRTVERKGDRPEVMIKVAKMNGEAVAAARVREAEALRIAGQPPVAKLWELVDRMRERAVMLLEAPKDESDDGV